MTMEVFDLARWQFGITTIYHFIFVPLTIGLAVLIAIMQTFYYRTENVIYRSMAQFWGRLFVILFTLGVVTGIVQEFQFGMNWSEYSRFVGDIFGIPLAIEALLAFFLESTFLGLWIFGWDKLPKWLHLLSIWLVAIGSTLSAIWILIANSWMQNPVGYELVAGRAELNDFIAIMLNERVLVQGTHTIIAAYVTGGLFVVGISAWHMLKKSQVEMFKRSLRIALPFTAIMALFTATSGHEQAQDTVTTQPMKMAAMEALWETEKPASFSMFAIIDQENQTSTRDLRLPYMLSVLSHNNTTSEVKGIKELQKEAVEKYGPGDYVPPVAIVYWGFRIMVGIGTFFILYLFWGLWLWWRGKLDNHRVFQKIALVTIFLPFISNAAGWIVTEMGRQPWVVYGLLKTSEAASPGVSGGAIWFSMIGFTLVYGILAVVGFYLIWRYGRPGFEEHAPLSGEKAHAY
jgi:cytochrome d ubiquinol oxidase subunit I